jgi:hypothetical protein
MARIPFLNHRKRRVSARNLLIQIPIPILLFFTFLSRTSDDFLFDITTFSITRFPEACIPCVQYFLERLHLSLNALPSEFRLFPYARFGNQVRQFTNALTCCYYLKIQRLVIPPRFLFLRVSFNTTCGVQVVLRPPPYENRTSGEFFYMHMRCLVPARQPTAVSFREVFWQSFANYTVFRKTIYFHVRSGDIFSAKRPNQYYPQPPCKYYLEAARLDGNVTKMVVMTDGGLNPCIGDLRKQGAVIDTSSLELTVGRLIHATRFALGSSSFSEAVTRLSRFYETGKFYMFGRMSTNLPRHWTCHPTVFYRKKVLTNWTASPEQRAIMRTDGCQRWSFSEEDVPRIECPYCEPGHFGG